MLFIALVLGAALVYVPLQYWHTRSTFPPIHDITTDTASPPRFNAVLAARAAEGANDVENRDAQLAQMQKTAYPDMVPVMTALPVRRAFNEALFTLRNRCRVGSSLPSMSMRAASRQVIKAVGSVSQMTS